MTAMVKTGFPVSGFLADTILVLNNSGSPSEPEAYKMDMVPTKTSRAAKELINATPIFQSKPMGLMAGSSHWPAMPA